VALNFVMVEYIVSASQEAWTVGSYSGNTHTHTHTQKCENFRTHSHSWNINVKD